MKLHNIVGGSREDLEAKKYTIGVGISLGNKWFTSDNILNLIKWSLDYSKDRVPVYVADSIHSVNIEVRNNKSPKNASRIADEKGTQILNEVRKKAGQELSAEEFNRLLFVKWKEIVDEKYQSKIEYLYSLRENNPEFGKAIENLVRNFTSQEENNSFTDSEIKRLGDYIIEELPEIIGRVLIGGVVCDAYAYPFSGEMVEFVNKIQKGLIFPEIREKIMDTEPKVFLEVR